ncbi:unnamed protein product [Rotaria sordida]|uniref:NAD(P)(+)--arginine ADP-ribosyltransferase n=1 Tax=Rotaria sordida TaxID=392033 RepID=A0A818NVC7_9BILA|nr:unnamed protein product [Rotaria sordida]
MKGPFLEKLIQDIEHLSKHSYKPNEQRYRDAAQQIRVCTNEETNEVEVLLDPIIACLSSKYYRDVYEKIIVSYAKISKSNLAAKHLFFMRDCPEFLLRHDYKRQDEVAALLCMKMLNNAEFILEQNLPSLNDSEEDEEIKKNADNEALLYHIKLLNHFAQIRSTRKNFLETRILDKILQILQNETLIHSTSRIGDIKTVLENDLVQKTIVEEKEGILFLTKFACIICPDDPISENIKKIRLSSLTIIWQLLSIVPTLSKKLKSNDLFIDHLLTFMNKISQKEKMIPSGIIWKLGHEETLRQEQAEKKKQLEQDDRTTIGDQYDSTDAWDDSVPFDLMMSYSDDSTEKEEIKKLFLRESSNRFNDDGTGHIDWMKCDDAAAELAKMYRFRHASIGWKKKDIDRRMKFIKEEMSHTDIERVGQFLNNAESDQNPYYLLKAYTVESDFYKKLNRDLATKHFNQGTNSGIIYFIDFFFNHPELEKLSFKGKVYRGMPITQDDLKQYGIGGKVMNKAFMSTTKDLDVAKNFAKNNLTYRQTEHGTQVKMAALCIYEIINDRTGLDIEPISEYALEREVLVGPYTAFVITAIRKIRPDYVEIDLRECEKANDDDGEEDDNDD